MNPQESKFILRTHRADGRYAVDDPVFAEALAEAGRSPELADWLAREHALDAAVANKIDATQPPVGLRETILAGARASRRSRPWWRQPRWMAVAAGLAGLVAIPAGLHFTRAPALSAERFAHLAADDSSQRSHDHTYAPPLTAIADELGTRTTPFTAGLDLSIERLRNANCANLHLGGRDVYEICFERDGVWFHLYVAKLEDTGTPGTERRPVFVQREPFAVASWTDGGHLYSLVTHAGHEALKKVV